MKWCRYEFGDRTSYGLVGGERVTEVSGDPFGEYMVTGTSRLLSQVRLLAPVIPTVFFCAGPNYRRHVEEMSDRRGAEAQFWPRPYPFYGAVNALIAHEETIVVPKDCPGAVQPEGQLAVVIGKETRRVSKEQALDHVFGYTIGIDISQRDWQQTDRTNYRAKNADTFKPVGPWVVTDLDPAGFHITVRHNGVVVEDFSSADQIWDLATWIHELSQAVTLSPGDMVWMGTEGSVGDMFPGDTVEVEISDIGTLRNYVVAEDG